MVVKAKISLYRNLKLSKARIAIAVMAFSLLGVYAVYRSLAVTTGMETGAAATMGVYKGAARPDLVSNFDGWMGRKVPGAVDFYPKQSWTEMKNNQAWQLKPWAESGYKMSLTIPMLPDEASSLAAGAAGQYNGHWNQIAINLVNANLGSATLRIGHEFNGTWYRWSAQNDPASWPVYWRQIVTTMRAVPGANFKYDWNPNNGHSNFVAASVYPGDAYVDIIGVDVYNQSWVSNYSDPTVRWNDIYNGQYGLQYWIQFAQSHNKPLSFPEWGTGTRPDGHGGGDDPNFIQKMYEVITSNNVIYHNYWDYCASDICGEFSNATTQFPQSAAKFKELFVPLLPTSPAPEISINNSTTGTAINQFEYSGNWTQEGGFHEEYYLGNRHLSSTTGSTYKLRFNGTQVKLYASKAPNGGIAGIAVNGGTEVAVDMYASARADKQLIYVSPVLASGAHVVTVRVTGTKSASSTGYMVTADRAVAVTATPSPPPPPIKQGDINNDGSVNIFDLSILLSNYGKPTAQASDPDCDINGNGTVDIFDLSILLSKYGT